MTSSTDAATTASGPIANNNGSTMASQQQEQQPQHQIHNHLAAGQQAPHSPNLGARIASVMIMGLTGVISRTFLYGFNDIEVKGLDRFKALLDSREDPERRERGLLTGGFMKEIVKSEECVTNSVNAVSNHISV